MNTLEEITGNIKATETITREMVEQRAKELFVAGIRHPYDPEQCWSDGTHVNYVYRTTFKVDKYQYYVKAWIELRDEAQYEEWQNRIHSRE